MADFHIKPHLLAVVAALALVNAVRPLPLLAQRESVRPGINNSFLKPDVENFIERFERDGRDAYDHRDAILKACGLREGMVVADVGAGTGLFTRLFAPLVGKEGRVYAVDISEVFVEHVQKTARENNLTNVTGVICGQDDAKLPPNSVDLVFICDTYHHFEFPHKTMRSIHRALRPDGHVVLIDFQRQEGVSSDWIMGHVRAGKEVFVGEIESSGFRQTESHDDLLKESYFVRFAKTELPPAADEAEGKSGE